MRRRSARPALRAAGRHRSTDREHSPALRSWLLRQEVLAALLDELPQPRNVRRTPCSQGVFDALLDVVDSVLEVLRSEGDQFLQGFVVQIPQSLPGCR